MKTLVRLGISVLAMAILGLGCSTRRAQVRHGDENFLSVSEPSRLVVQISNVTDDNKSRRNEAELFVNGKKIKPSRSAGNGQRDYVYELSLPSGEHTIQAKYRAKSFWKDKEFKLATHDGRVRLYPGYTTFLTMTLEKKSDGSLARERNYFTEVPRAQGKTAAPRIAESAQPARKIVEATRAVPTEVQQEHESISLAQQARPLVVVPVAPPTSAPTFSSAPATNTIQVSTPEPAAPIVTLDRVLVPTVRVEEKPVFVAPVYVEPATSPAVVERAAPINSTQVTNAHTESAAAAVGKIALQINTTPANAEVIVDDKYLGQSPLVTYVERGRSHVIQISKKGFADKIKLLDRNEFDKQQSYFLIEKLEKEE